jgi:hypothetical protein
METKVEGPRVAEFILSEASGMRSRENGVVKEGENLTAGTVVQFDGDKLVAFTATTDTNDDLSPGPAGVLIYPVDATDADVAASYIARDAEVKLPYLVYPAETTNGNEEALTIAGLATLNIHTR